MNSDIKKDPNYRLGYKMFKSGEQGTDKQRENIAWIVGQWDAMEDVEENKKGRKFKSGL